MDVPLAVKAEKETWSMFNIWPLGKHWPFHLWDPQIHSAILFYMEEFDKILCKCYQGLGIHWFFCHSTIELESNRTSCSMLLTSSFGNGIFPSKPTRRQRPSAVGGASERSERGRSALFKNPLFFSCKFLGCYIEAAQNFFMYVQFSIRIGHKKLPSLNWF